MSTTHDLSSDVSEVATTQLWETMKAKAEAIIPELTALLWLVHGGDEGTDIGAMEQSIQKISELAEKMVPLQEDMDKMQALKTNVERELTISQGRLADMNADHTKCSDALKGLQTRSKTLQEYIGHQEKRKAELTSELDNALANLQQIRVNIDELDARQRALDDQEDRHKKIEQVLEARSKNVETREGQVQKENADLQKISKQFESAKAKFLEQSGSKLKSQQELRQKLDEEKERMERDTQQLRTDRIKIREEQESLSTTRLEMSILQSQINEGTKKNDEDRKDLSTQRQDLEADRGKIDELSSNYRDDCGRLVVQQNDVLQIAVALRQNLNDVFRLIGLTSKLPPANETHLMLEKVVPLLSELRKYIDSLHEGRTTLVQISQQANHDIEELNTSMKNLVDTHDQTLDELKTAKDMNATLKVENESYITEIQGHRGTNVSLKEDIDRLQEANTTLESERSKSLDEHRTAMATKSCEQHSLKRNYDAMNMKQSRLTEQVTRYEEDEKAWRANIVRLSEDFTETNSVLSKQRENALKLSSSLSDQNLALSSQNLTLQKENSATEIRLGQLMMNQLANDKKLMENSAEHRANFRNNRLTIDNYKSAANLNADILKTQTDELMVREEKLKVAQTQHAIAKEKLRIDRLNLEADRAKFDDTFDCCEKIMIDLVEGKI